MLRTWSQSRLEWAKQLSYLARLHNKLSREGGDEGSFRQVLRRRLADLIDGAPLQKSPQALRDAALPLVERLSVQQQLVARISEIEAQAREQGGAAWRTWQVRCTALRRRADTLAEGQGAVDGLQAELDRAQADLERELQANAGDTPDSSDDAPMTTLHRAALSGAAPAGGIEPVPATQLSRLDTPGRAAWRLQVFLLGTYGVMLVLLAGAGLNEVYGKRPTFGADLLGDYLTLLLWGFGAEATRDSIATALRGGAPSPEKAAAEHNEAAATS